MIALDGLRAIGKEPETLERVRAEIRIAGGADAFCASRLDGDGGRASTGSRRRQAEVRSHTLPRATRRAA